MVAANAQAGIYRIRNILNEKVYVGQTSNIHVRWGQHKYRLWRGTHANPHLQAAWNKYGADAFVFEVTTTCDLSALGAKEIEALAVVPKHLRYNIGPAGDNAHLGVPQTPERKLKHSRSKGGRAFFAIAEDGTRTRFEHGGEACTFFGVPNISIVYACLHGKHKSWRGYRFEYDPDCPAQPRPTPPAPKPRKRRVESFEGRARRRKPNKRSRPVICTCKETGVETRFPYIDEAARVIGIAPPQIRAVLSGRCSSTRHHFWRYAENEKAP